MNTQHQHTPTNKNSRPLILLLAASAAIATLNACQSTKTIESSKPTPITQTTPANQHEQQQQQQQPEHREPAQQVQPTPHESAAKQQDQQEHHQQQQQQQQQQAREPNPRPFRPHVRLDAATRTVEFDGIVPIAVGMPGSPVVYLELVACTPDTKEHESLVMTDARPSDIHAALLLTGLEPGSPASFKWDGTDLNVIQPEGPPIKVTLIWTSNTGQRHEDQISQWVTSEDSGQRFNPNNTPWLFAGSNIRDHRGQSIYEADYSGCVIGLTTFGSELLAYPEPISPDSNIVPPEWIADPTRVPPPGTQVTVRLQAATNESTR